MGGDGIEKEITAADRDDIADTTVLVDTVTYIRTKALDLYAAVDNQTNFETKLVQNPTIALVKSMVIPGLGQFGNRKKVKGVFFLALDAWFVSSAIHYKRQASDFRNMYEQSTTVTSRNNWYVKFESKRDQRNKFTWFAVIVTFVSMFDAYADAHLSGFPILRDEANSTIQVGPNDNGDMSAAMVFRF